METINENENQLSFNIDINEEYGLNDVFINLKSEPLEKQLEKDIPNILQENRIVLKKDDEWYASKYSYAHLQEKNIKIIKHIIEIFKKYGNLYWYVYEKNNTYNVFVINKNLALNYFEQISKYYLENYEINNINVFLHISNNIDKSIIQNTRLEDINISEYSFINDLYFSFEEQQKTIENKKSDMELLLPLDISKIMEKINKYFNNNNNNNDNNNDDTTSNFITAEQVLSNEEKIKFAKFRDLYIQLLDDKKDESKVIIKIEQKNTIVEISETDMLNVIQLFEKI